LTGPRWLSGRADVGKYLGVSGRQASRLRTRFRDFPGKVIDGRLTANTADLDAWMRKREHTCSLCGLTAPNETCNMALPHPPN
jgi:hypothetical protein